MIDLWATLRKCEALARDGATQGERDAARTACERLRARIQHENPPRPAPPPPDAHALDVLRRAHEFAMIRETLRQTQAILDRSRRALPAAEDPNEHAEGPAETRWISGMIGPRSRR